MQKQLSHPQRIAVKDIALFIGTDVHPVDEYFPVFDAAPCILEIDLALTDGLDLRAAQDDTGLDLLKYEVVVVGLAIGRNRLFLHILHVTTPPTHTI